MSADPSVIAALEAAVNADPSNAALRLHLATMLVQASRPAEALEHAVKILAVQPDHLEALKLAADTAEATGDPIRAQAYRNLHDSLSWNKAKNLIESSTPDRPMPDPTPPQKHAPIPEGPCGDPFDDDDEDFGPSKGSWEIETPDLTLSDVAGLEDVKRRLNLSFLGPMRNPDMRKLYGKSLKGGLLLYGPPGCGKTYIARAVAGELGARFMSIGITDVIDMWIGNSEKNLHSIFESARRNSPCVIFFDEIDAIGRKRSLMRDHAGRSTINQLLAELDGVQSNNEGVYVLAATNSPWDVDAAMRRPGRLDRTVLVLPPDKTARAAIVRSNMKDRPQEGIDAEAIADKTDDFSGADIAHLVESAAEHAMEDSLKRGQARPIKMDDFKKALKEVKPSIRPWLETARNYVAYANDGGAYDDLAEYLRRRRIM